MTLTGKQRRHLRALGHHLQPIVILGKQGITEGVAQALQEALDQHELVKVRIGGECPDDEESVRQWAEQTVQCEVAQVLGNTMLVYRRHPKKPVIELP